MWLKGSSKIISAAYAKQCLNYCYKWSAISIVIASFDLYSTDEIILWLFQLFIRTNLRDRSRVSVAYSRKPVLTSPRNNSTIAGVQCSCHQSVSFADWKQGGCIGRSAAPHSALLPIDSGLRRAAFDFRLDYLCPTRILHNVQLHAALRSKMERRRPRSSAARDFCSLGRISIFDAI